VLGTLEAAASRGLECDCHPEGPTGSELQPGAAQVEGAPIFFPYKEGRKGRNQKDLAAAMQHAACAGRETWAL